MEIINLMALNEEKIEIQTAAWAARKAGAVILAKKLQNDVNDLERFIKRAARNMHATKKLLCIRGEEESCRDDASETPGAECAGSNCGWCHRCFRFEVDGLWFCTANACCDE